MSTGMSDVEARGASAGRRLEVALERGLFGSRWLMAPFYVGLVFSLLLLIAVFVRQLVYYAPQALTLTPEGAILAILALIDLSLAANLVLIVIFSGYENFVSRIDSAPLEDRPAWMGTVDFSGLKLKLIASIVAISGIDLLKSFMGIGRPEAMELSDQALAWKTGIHLTFVVSGVLLALMDWLSSRAKRQPAL